MAGHSRLRQYWGIGWPSSRWASSPRVPGSIVLASARTLPSQNTNWQRPGWALPNFQPSSTWVATARGAVIQRDRRGQDLLGSGNGVGVNRLGGVHAGVRPLGLPLPVEVTLFQVGQQQPRPGRTFREGVTVGRQRLVGVLVEVT